MSHATAEPAILASMTKMQHNSETESDDRSQVSHELSLLNFDAVLTFTERIPVCLLSSASATLRCSGLPV